MKILITGLVVFLAWSAASSYWYICKIKNLCPGEHVEEIVVEADETLLDEARTEVAPDTVSLPAEVEVTSPGEITLYCAFNSADFMPSGDLEKYLKQLSEYLKANPDKKVSITGHTDDVGSDQFNRTLGLERATHLRDHMASHGLEPTLVMVNSAGETKPVADNSTEEGRAKNRRIVITISEQ